LSQIKSKSLLKCWVSISTGLAFTPDGNLLLSAWDDQNISTVFTISPQGTTTVVLVTLPDAIFLNGLTPLAEDRYLIADSYRGCIWELNLAEKTVRVWLEHSDLARSSSDKEFPAVNGLKIYGNSLYASNTEKMQFVRIPILLNGQLGKPEIFLQPSIWLLSTHKSCCSRMRPVIVGQSLWRILS
jgi:hypothetical protein